MSKIIEDHIKLRTKVYSIKYGVGVIIGILNLYDGIEDYIEVKFDKNEQIKHFPLSYLDLIRLTSDLTSLTKELRMMSENLNSKDPKIKQSLKDGTKDDENLEFLINAITNLVIKNKLSKKEELVLSCYFDSLILEISHVFNIELLSARDVVSEYMRRALE